MQCGGFSGRLPMIAQDLETTKKAEMVVIRPSVRKNDEPPSKECSL